MNMEFLHTKDPMFFNKPPTQDFTFKQKETVKLTYRVFPCDDVPARQTKPKRLAPYDDNEGIIWFGSFIASLLYHWDF